MVDALELLIALVGQLEAARPDEALALYRRLIPSVVGQTNNHAYDDAIRLLRRVGELMKAQSQTTQFRAYLSELRVSCKPKRNFIKLLDQLAQHRAD